MSRRSMAQSEFKSTAPFQPSKLRNSVISSCGPARPPAAGQHRTCGHRTPLEDEPRIPRSPRTPELRPASSMSLPSTTSSLERRLSAREQRLSMLNRSRTVIDDDSASESESWTVRAERRRSLARQLTSPSLRDAADDGPPRAELPPRRSVSAAQVRHTMSKPFSRPVSHVASRMMMDDTKQEKHTTDVEMASRVLRAWETMARRLDELSRSTDGGRPTGAVGPQKYAELPMDISGLMISTPQERVVRYPCPFRKRNPVRFNIRDHESCAKAPFDSILDLRRHIVSYHRHRYPPRQCRRCKANFESQAALWSHMMLPKDQMCELDPTQVGDPEDGISDEQASHLCENNPKADWSWERIWHLVFPEDVQVTDPDWQPIIELSEIDQAFEDNEEELKKDLKKSLRLFLPEELQDDYCGFVAGQLELVFQTHRAYVIRQCINRLDATQNPYKADASQQTAARRSTRRSRQSSMFQSSKTSSVIGTRTPNRFSTDSSNQRRHHRVASTPPPPNDSYDTSSTSPTLIDEDDDHTVGRDSGMGISCHICGREACICTSTLATHQENRVVYETQQEYWPLSPRKNERKASMEVRGRYLRRQPDRASLRVRVGDDLEPFRGETGSGSEDGRFSPQSFKQRVMRREVHVESGI